jgi:hypothetical protein
MATIALSALVGTLLALRFRVFVLIPTTIFAVLVTAAVDARTPAVTIFIHMVVVATALQFGYLVGALLWNALHKLIPSTTDVEETSAHRRGSGIFPGMIG